MFVNVTSMQLTLCKWWVQSPHWALLLSILVIMVLLDTLQAGFKPAWEVGPLAWMLKAAASIVSVISAPLEARRLRFTQMLHNSSLLPLHSFCNEIPAPMPKKKWALPLELYKLCCVNPIWPLDLVRLTCMNQWSDLLSKTHSLITQRPIRGGSTH